MTNNPYIENVEEIKDIMRNGVNGDGKEVDWLVARDAWQSKNRDKIGSDTNMIKQWQDEFQAYMIKQM